MAANIEVQGESPGQVGRRRARSARRSAAWRRQRLGHGADTNAWRAPPPPPLRTDGPNDEGEMFDRPGKLSDKMPSPYANEVRPCAAATRGAKPQGRGAARPGSRKLRAAAGAEADAAPCRHHVGGSPLRQRRRLPPRPQPDHQGKWALPSSRRSRRTLPTRDRSRRPAAGGPAHLPIFPLFSPAPCLPGGRRPATTATTTCSALSWATGSLLPACRCAAPSQPRRAAPRCAAAAGAAAPRLTQPLQLTVLGAPLFVRNLAYLDLI